MTSKPGNRYLLIGFLAGCASPLLFSQQSGLQTSFFSRAAHVSDSDTATAGDDIAVGDNEDLPYINLVAKESKTGVASFQPNASDLLIAQAEAKFQSGRKFYRDRNYDQARKDFDDAIDLMLQA